MRYRASILCAAFTVAIFVVPLHAQSPANNTLSLGPSITDVSADPGTTESKRITIANQGAKQFTLALSVAPYTIINDKYEASFEPIEGRRPVHEWIQFTGPRVSVLDPGKYLDVDFTVKVPAGTPPGGYSAVILAESAGNQPGKSGVQIRNRIAHIVYITVKGNVQRKGYVEGPHVSLLGFTGDQSLKQVLYNEGGSNEKAKVTTTIKDIFGREILTNTTERYVLPSTKRVLETAWVSNGFFGVYTIATVGEIAEKTYESSKWCVRFSPLFALLIIISAFMIIWQYTVRFSKTRARKR